LTVLTKNSNKSVQVRQENIKRERLKIFSFILVFLATLLLILNIIDIKMVFGKTEVGLWDNFPGIVSGLSNFVGDILCAIYCD
jgi:lipopolysaccharide export LptBFGC system permease protein LptF